MSKGGGIPFCFVWFFSPRARSGVFGCRRDEARSSVRSRCATPPLSTIPPIPVPITKNNNRIRPRILRLSFSLSKHAHETKPCRHRVSAEKKPRHPIPAQPDPFGPPMEMERKTHVMETEHLVEGGAMVSVWSICDGRERAMPPPPDALTARELPTPPNIPPQTARGRGAYGARPLPRRRRQGRPPRRGRPLARQGHRQPARHAPRPRAGCGGRRRGAAEGVTRPPLAGAFAGVCVCL